MRYVEDSTMTITRVVQEFTDQFGRKVRRITKEITDKPLQLGSINKPINDDIINVEIVVPKRIQEKDKFINFKGLT